MNSHKREAILRFHCCCQMVKETLLWLTTGFFYSDMTLAFCFKISISVSQDLSSHINVVDYQFFYNQSINEIHYVHPPCLLNLMTYSSM